MYKPSVLVDGYLRNFVVYALTHLICMHMGAFRYSKGRYISVISLYPFWDVHINIYIARCLLQSDNEYGIKVIA